MSIGLYIYIYIYRNHYGVGLIIYETEQVEDEYISK